MGYDLSLQTNPIVEYRWTSEWWPKVLKLAEQYGWAPKGTLPPLVWSEKHPNEQWDGNYSWNGGQVVDTDDSMKLAAALRKGLNDQREFTQQELMDFIEFCEQGAFVIN